MRQKVNVSCIRLLLLAVLHISTFAAAQVTLAANTTVTSSTTKPTVLGYLTRPVDVTVALGEPAVFKCGVSETAPNLTFTLSGSHGSYSLSCPQGHVEDIPQALNGWCKVENGESLAVWSIKGTSLSDNNSKVTCQQLNNQEILSAILHVDGDNGPSQASLIGCLVGGFLGILLVFAILYFAMQRSETLRNALCLYGDTEDDLDTIISDIAEKNAEG